MISKVEQFLLLRIGSYPLRIETGRWVGEFLEERLCFKCMSGQVEDEKHFLIDCKAYKVPRRILFARIREISRDIWNLFACPREMVWFCLMGSYSGQLGEQILRHLLVFLKEAHYI